MAKTTRADFEKFQVYCEHWRRVFGIQDYNFAYVHQVVEAAFAQCRADAEGHTVTITLGIDWKRVKVVEDEQLKRTSLHEILHVVLNVVSDLAMSRCIMRNEFDTAEEATVVRLENGIFEILKGGKRNGHGKIPEGGVL